MKTLCAFILGMLEFRSDVTSNPGAEYIESYDAGRELAHKLTFHKFDRS